MLAQPTNNQKFFDTDKILVSKTDLKGKIRYANKEFLDIVGLSEEEVIGKPHNIIRHPDMPRVIFKYLWEFLHQELEINAYVKNLCADGGYYWVCANVTPSFDVQGKVIGYHSARRAPTKEALDVIIPLYEKLLSLEKSGGMQASETYMQDLLNEKGVQYDEFILSI
jgi:PAS domain S-box-containing protein